MEQYPNCKRCGRPLTEVERDMPENPASFYDSHFSCGAIRFETAGVIEGGKVRVVSLEAQS